MHDPMTVAFEIKYPWRRDKPWPTGIKKWEDLKPAQRRGRSRLWKEGCRDSFITIWHIDPETDGSDDSCGWAFPKLGDAENKVVDEMLSWEKTSPYYFLCFSYVHNPEYQYESVSPGDCLSLCITGIGDVAWRLDERRMDGALMSLAVGLATNPSDNLQACFATGGETDHQVERAKRGAFHSLVRCYMSERRRWWQHPKWHLRHWHFQVHPVQNFKRWAFSRCKWCRKGFGWHEQVLGYSWDGGGPRWFRSETDIAHFDCDKARKVCTPAVQEEKR